MYLVFLLTLLLACLVELASSYSNGAPNITQVCTTLNPSHGNSTATGVAPYNLSLSANTYNPGDVIQGTLSGVGGAQFKGFLIAARRSSGQADNIGNFGAETGSHVTCTQALGDALTQSNSSIKSSVRFNWTAPSTSVGDVVFHYTVVRGGAPNTISNRADYFQGSVSSTLKAVAVNSFSKNSECGITRGCISNCLNNVCQWELSWKNAGAKYEITLKSVVASNNAYVSLGFSNVSAMGPASVVSCVVNNGHVTVNTSFTTVHFCLPLTNVEDGISNETNSYINGLLECSFSRDTISTNPQIFNLTDPWFIIAARGPVYPNGTLGKHGRDDRYLTNVRVDLSNATTDYSFAVATTTPLPGPTTSPSQGNSFKKDPACGKTKGCYTKCSNDDQCDLLVSWQLQESNFEITLKSVFATPGDHYISFGLSNDTKMCPASVLSCTVYNSIVGVVESLNPGYFNSPLANQREGLSNFTGSYINGILTCTVLREAKSNNSDIYDMTQLWYIIAARGQALAGGNLKIHDTSQAFTMSKRTNFTNPSDESAETLSYPLVKAHGCLMAIAWMFAASLGLIMARFFKKMWPDSKLCGLKVWFAVHRAAMVATFIIGIAAFVIIFIQVKAYSDIPGETFKKVHPILGIIVTGLLFINPFMSLLRCGPTHPKRPIFNWAHWLVGTSSHILGGVTIVLGLYLPKSSLNADKGLIIMIVYGSEYLVYFLIMTLLDYLSSRQNNGDSQIQKGMELTKVPYGFLTNENEPQYSGLKKLLTLAHFVIVLCLTAALMYLIISGDI